LYIGYLTTVWSSCTVINHADRVPKRLITSISTSNRC